MTVLARIGVLAALAGAGLAAFTGPALAAKTLELRYAGDYAVPLGAGMYLQDTEGMTLRADKDTIDCPHFTSGDERITPLAFEGPLESNNVKTDRIGGTDNSDELRGCDSLTFGDFVASSSATTLSTNGKAVMSIYFAVDTYPECNYEGVMKGTWSSGPNLQLSFKEQLLKVTEPEKAKAKQCYKTLRATINFAVVEYTKESARYGVEAVIR